MSNSIVQQLMDSANSVSKSISEHALYRPQKHAIGGKDISEKDISPLYRDLTTPKTWDATNWITKAAHWKGTHIWYSGPRGSGISEVFRQRIKILNETQTPMLMLVPFHRHAEAWSLWSINNNVNLQAFTPETLAFKLTSDFHEELGYRRPPSWADEETKEDIEKVWNDVQKNFIKQFFTQQNNEELKMGSHTLMLSNPAKHETMQEDVEQIFFTRIIQKFQEDCKVNPHLAHGLLAHILPSRGDLCREIARQYPLVFIDSPEHMDPQIFKWLRIIKPESINVGSNYPFENPTQKYPWIDKNVGNPDSRNQMEHQNMILGVQSKKWSRCGVLNRFARGMHGSNIEVERDDKRTTLNVNIRTAESQKTEKKADSSRNLHMTVWNQKNETGKWVSEWILRFQKAKERGDLKELTHQLHSEKSFEPPPLHPLLSNDEDQNSGGINQDIENGIQVLLVSPVSSYHDPRIQQWEEYILNSFEPIIEIQAQFRYLGLSDGPDQVGSEPLKQKQMPPTIWIGNPLAAVGTQFDLVLIPEFNQGQWPASENVSWDWLDIAVSRAKWACMAYTKKEEAPQFLQNEIQSIAAKEPAIGNLRFSPLFQKNN